MRELTATSAALIAVSADALDLRPSYVAWIWRKLREAGLVGAGRNGRGGGPAVVSPQEAAVLVTALAVDVSAKNAPAAVKSFSTVVYFIEQMIHGLATPGTRQEMLKTAKTIEFSDEDPDVPVFRITKLRMTALAEVATVFRNVTKEP